MPTSLAAGTPPTPSLKPEQRPPCLLLQIVAGLEPEATNTMLQMLAAAVQQGDSAAAVQAVLGRLAEPANAASGAAGVSTDGGSSRHRALTAPTAGGLRDQGLVGDAGSADEDAAPVVFARLDNLLPALGRKMEEARQVLTGTGAAVGSAEAWARCGKVQAIAQVRLGVSRFFPRVYGIVASTRLVFVRQ